MGITVATVLLLLSAAVSGRLLDLDQFYEADGNLYTAVHNETMEWGTYKPNMFFGVKDRSPTPLTVGLAWVVPVANGGFEVRHTYRYQSGDGVTAYFEYHDGWGASRQIVEDPYANARFEIDFVKQIIVED